MYSSESDFRIEVTYRDSNKDPSANGVRRLLRDLGKFKVKSVEFIDVYMLHLDISESLALRIADEICTDHIIQRNTVNVPITHDADFLIERKPQSGVTDPRANILREQIELLLARPLRDSEWVQTATGYLLKGCTMQVAKAAEKLLANPLVHQTALYEKGKWPWMSPPQPVGEDSTGVVDEIDLDSALRGSVDDVLKKTGFRYWQLLTMDNKSLAKHGISKRKASYEDLITISERSTLSLTVNELKVFRDYFKRPSVIKKRKAIGLNKPTDAELEAFAQTQSEHCKHKIFNAIINFDEGEKKTVIESIFKTYIKAPTQSLARKRKDLLSVFSDNAGIIAFDKDLALGFKVETHNAPSALDPFGGAETGIVGVNRDILGAGLGLSPLANTNVFCLCNPKYSGILPQGVIHPYSIFEGVRAGVESGGNKSGIPTVNGAYAFDDDFLCRPLVFCGTVGIGPRMIGSKSIVQKRARPENAIVMVGGRVGKDGIHGATFSSAYLSEKSSTAAVQIADPFTQKKMGDALIEARDKGLIESITDNGAGGLSSSIGEMALQAGGCEIDLQKVPLKYNGLAPWQILVSESQERMCVAVTAVKLDEFIHLCKSRGVEATVIGSFNASGMFYARYGESPIAYLDLSFLHEGLPPLQLEAKLEPTKINRKGKRPTLKTAFLTLLGDLNVCSKEYTIRQFDHEVKSLSIIKPLTGPLMDGPSDAAVLKPRSDSWRGIAIGCGLAPSLSEHDAYQMALNSIDEAVRNIVCTGADPSSIILLDNFCWPDPVFDKEKNPDGRHKLAQLVLAARGVHDSALRLGMPFISGKDSMKNDFTYTERGIKRKRSIKPTLLISSIGTLNDIRKAVSSDAKSPGDIIYVVGSTRDELVGTRYANNFAISESSIPKVNLNTSRSVFDAIYKSITKGFVQSCHDCSEGGLAIALAEVAIGGSLGMTLDSRLIQNNEKLEDNSFLFSESPTRFVVTVEPSNVAGFEAILKRIPFAPLGKVTATQIFSIRTKSTTLRLQLKKIKTVWKQPLAFGETNGIS